LISILIGYGFTLTIYDLSVCSEPRRLADFAALLKKRTSLSPFTKSVISITDVAESFQNAFISNEKEIGCRFEFETDENIGDVESFAYTA